MTLSARDAARPDRWKGDDLEARRAEFVSLRNEILVRVIFQNLLLCLCWVAWGAILVAAGTTERGEVCAVYAALATAAAAMWAHHGARTAQIRAYLQASLEPALNLRPQSGWEHALAKMRFDSLLGTRWAVSTKGFLVGSQIVCAIGAAMLAAPLWALSVLGAGIAATGWLVHEPPLRIGER